MKKQTPPKDRGNLTLAEVLEKDKCASVPGHNNEMPYLTIPVRDWLTKFVAGEKTPFADLIDPAQYQVVELAVSVLVEQGDVTGKMLPESAIDYVQEWLYRLEEETNLHVWNVADIARPFLTHALSIDDISDDKSSGVVAIQAALSRLCTEGELNSFYKRHGLDHKDERSYKGSQKWRDQQVAVKAARVLADPTVPVETKDAIRDAMNDLSTDSGVPTWHPALAERALTLMFESKEYVTGKASVQQSRKRLRELVRAVPDSEHTHKPASLKK